MFSDKHKELMSQKLDRLDSDVNRQQLPKQSTTQGFLALPKKLQELVLTNPELYTLENAERLARIDKLYTNERAKMFLKQEEIDSLSQEFGQLDLLLSFEGCLMLFEKLITAEEAKLIPYQTLKALLSPYGCQMLRERRINPAEAIESKTLYVMLCQNGCDLVREGRMTFKDAESFKDNILQLRVLLSDDGSKMLRKGLIGLDLAKAIPQLSLKLLLTSHFNGPALLEGKHIKAEDIIGMRRSHLKSLLVSNEFYRMFQAGEMTIEKFKEIPEKELPALSDNELENLARFYFDSGNRPQTFKSFTAFNDKLDEFKQQEASTKVGSLSVS